MATFCAWLRREKFCAWGVDVGDAALDFALSAIRWSAGSVSRYDRSEARYDSRSSLMETVVMIDGTSG